MFWLARLFSGDCRYHLEVPTFDRSKAKEIYTHAMPGRYFSAEYVRAMSEMATRPGVYAPFLPDPSAATAEWRQPERQLSELTIGQLRTLIASWWATGPDPDIQPTAHWQ